MKLTIKRNKKITTEEIKKNIDKNGNVIIRAEKPEGINFISASYRRKTMSMPEWFREWSISFEKRINDRFEKIENRLSVLEGFHKKEYK